VPDEESYQPWPPVEAGTVPSTPRRRLLALTAAAIGAVVGLTALCGVAVVLSMRAADGDLGRKPPMVAPTLDPPSVSPFGGHYDVPGNLCSATDFTGLRPLFTMHSGQEPSRSAASGEGVVRECVGTTGNDAVSGQYRVVATVYPDAGAASTAFVAIVKSGPGTAVPALGQQGWVYRDPERGRTVTVLDANLILAMSWRDDARPTVDPEGLDDALARVLRSTLGLLKAN